MADKPYPARGLLADRLDHLFRTVHPKDRGPYTPAEVAEAINKAAGEKVISSTYVWQLRTGRRGNPTQRHLSALAAFFGVSPMYFFDDTEADRDAIPAELTAALKDGEVREMALELKWPIDALTLHDTKKNDDIILAGSRQLAKRRRELRDGDGMVKLPPGWPGLSDVEWTWGVGTPQQLYTGPLAEPEIFSTSFRYMRSLDSPETIETVISALREPDVPQLGQHYTVNKATMQLGWDVIHFDSIHVLDTTWRPRPA
jgi:transcriptional regulator with XRE-family HTH domain